MPPPRSPVRSDGANQPAGKCTAFFGSCLGSFEDLDRLAGPDLHDRLLPAGLAALDEPTALRLRADLDDVHALDVHVEQLLDGLPDLGLVRVRVDAERVAMVALDLFVALLRDHGCEQDLVGMKAHEALTSTAPRAAWLTRSERAQTSAATSISAGVTTWTPARLRNDFAIAAWSSWATTMSGRSFPHASTSSAASRADGSSNESSARTANVPSSACADSAARNAALRSLRLILWPKLVRTWNATPPPVQCGARVVPARARPVPFWRHGFERPPATRPRLLTARVPARSALSSARTVSWTRWGFTSAPKTCASSVRSFDLFPSPSRTGALRRRLGDAVWRSAGLCPVDRFVPASDLGAATAHLLPDFHQPVLWPRNGAFDEQQVLLRVDRVDGQADLRYALAAQPAGHLDPLEDPRPP